MNAKRTTQSCNTPRWLLPLLAVAMVCGMSGCTTLLAPVTGVPAHRVPPKFLGTPRNNLEPINLAMLRQDPPATYLLGPKDVLGIYIEGVLGRAEEAPPVHFPEDGSRAPAIGYPIPIRDDGTIALPLVPPINVTGLTLTQAQDRIRQEYVPAILREGRDRIIVTLIRARTYQVVVIRQDAGGGGGRNFQNTGSQAQFIRGSSQVGTGQTVNLRAYENDVLHALAATGGLPGVDAKNEVQIIRGRYLDAQKRQEVIRAHLEKYSKDECLCPPDFPDDPNVLRIPLRLPPGEIPRLKQEDIILQDGDIVLIESRETEVFYTGGLLGGREIPLPRDYDLDILGAIALAGGAVAQNPGGLGLIGVGGAAPTNCIVLRKLACGDQMTIEVDLVKALNQPQNRILIQPGDTLILRYKPIEELTNFGLGTFFTYGIRQLFNNN